MSTKADRSDLSKENFSGNCVQNTVAASSQRYICPFGLNATLATDPANAEVFLQEKTTVKMFRVKTLSVQSGTGTLVFQLVVNGVPIDTIPLPAGQGVGTYELDFPRGPWQINPTDSVCIGLLNNATVVSAKIGAFGLG